MSRLLCRLRIHRWDYSGSAHTHAPRPIRCERCGTRYGTRHPKEADHG